MNHRFFFSIDKFSLQKWLKEMNNQDCKQVYICIRGLQ